MIKLTKMCKSFNGRVVFSDFSYSFQDKGAYALIGVSGSGKTTLLRLLSGLESPDSGEISEIPPVAVSFQEYRLFPHLSAFDNVIRVLYEKPNDLQISLVRDAFDRLALTDAMQKKPRELSGGMKQRVSLIRALMSDAPVLLLDEPTKELDPDLSESVARWIEELSSVKTVIFTAHNEELARKVGATLVPIDNHSKA